MANILNKYQIRTLNADLSAASADIADLRLSNLIVGKKYKLTINLLAVNGDGNAQITATHNGSIILRAQQKTTAAGGEDRTSASASLIFTATATTVIFAYLESDPAASQLDGNGTTQETFVMLEEMPTNVLTTQWT